MQKNQRLEGGTRLAKESVRGDQQYPLVTVITAVFNGEAHLEACLESVRSQNYPNFEHIVIDAGSQDGTIALLQRYESSIALWISEPDNGVYDAWNKGLALARGEWIAFLGSDDVYLAGAIDAYIALAREHPEADFLASRARLDHVTGYAPTFGGPWQWPRFTRAMTTIHVGTLHRRRLFERLGTFNPRYRIAGDYEFLLRAKDGLKTAFTSRTTVVMRAGGLSDSTAGLYEARKAKLENGVRGWFGAEIELRRAIVRFHARSFYLKLRAKVLSITAR